MVLSEIDRNLLERCLQRQPRSWEDFVDRFLGLVVHVINHTAEARSIRLTAEDREDLCGDVLLTILNHDFAALRKFRRESSLATYLTVIARRVVVRELLKKKSMAPLTDAALEMMSADSSRNATEQRISNQEEVQRLLDGLPDREAEVVRLYHLEGQSYHEISSRVGVPENSIGPTLTRAREKLRLRQT